MAGLYYPRSFLRLLTAGFAVVALPMMAALVSYAIAMDRLANRSQQAVHQAVLVTQHSRRLGELLTALERAANQMAILADSSLLDAYNLSRAQFLDTTRGFSTLSVDDAQRSALMTIIAGEAAVFAALSDAALSAEALKEVLAVFPGLALQARTITARGNELIEREVQDMRHAAREAQRTTLWQLLALIPVVIILVAGLTLIIARPIRQFEQAVRRLGGGDLTVPVVVSGPEDLQALGEHLDWMRTRLLDLEQQKNRFLRHMSHELKTPLTALREGAELLAEGAVGSLTPEQREIAEILRHKSIELQKLIEDLLAYGASQFRESALELSTFELGAVTDRVSVDQRLALRAKHITLDIDAPPLTLTADFEKLRVMLDNLLSNAIKFSPPGGVIAVKAHAAGNTLELVVADRGPGIAAGDRERVFDPFYKGGAGTDALVKGTGIGLSVVREYARLHGGSVAIAEDAGPGARLVISLPLRAAAAGMAS